MYFLYILHQNAHFLFEIWPVLWKEASIKAYNFLPAVVYGVVLDFIYMLNLKPETILDFRVMRFLNCLTVCENFLVLFA